MEPKDPWSASQDALTSPYPKPNEYSPYPPNLYPLLLQADSSLYRLYESPPPPLRVMCPVHIILDLNSWYTTWRVIKLIALFIYCAWAWSWSYRLRMSRVVMKLLSDIIRVYGDRRKERHRNITKFTTIRLAFVLCKLNIFYYLQGSCPEIRHNLTGYRTRLQRWEASS
jgi:hypothetical protein